MELQTDPRHIARTLIRDFYDYRSAWRYALKIGRSGGCLAAAYTAAAEIIADECYLKTARPIYS